MSKVKIKITSIQGIGKETERIENICFGNLIKTEDGFSLSYTEKKEKDIPKTDTTVLINADKTATIIRSGGLSSKLIIKENEKTECLYSTPIGDMTLEFFGKRINYRLTDSSGEIYLNYSISQKDNLISNNEVRIIIKEV